MLDYLELINCQSHKKTRIDFSPGVNVIIGPSNYGKSTIIRMIYYTLFNQPRNVDYTRRGENYFSSELGINGKVLKRIKGEEGINEYHLDKEEWKGFGSAVPKEIVDKINVKPIDLDTDLSMVLNVQKQLEAPFILSETESIKSKFLNRLSNSHMINIAIRNLLKDCKEISTKNTVLNTQVSSAKDMLKGFEYLDSVPMALEYVENKISNLKEMEKSLNELIDIKNELDEYNRAKYIVQAQEGRFNIDLEALESNIGRLQELIGLQSEYRVVASEINFRELDIVRNTDNYNKAVNEYENKLKELGICPTCHQTIGKDFHCDTN